VNTGAGAAHIDAMLVGSLKIQLMLGYPLNVTEFQL
jgi:hypothetical protein